MLRIDCRINSRNLWRFLLLCGLTSSIWIEGVVFSRYEFVSISKNFLNYSFIFSLATLILTSKMKFHTFESYLKNIFITVHELVIYKEPQSLSEVSVRLKHVIVKVQSLL